MSNLETRHQLRSDLAAFLWNQWAQLGISATHTGRDTWAADPEALLLLSFEVGREHPRLFEQVLDWLVRNERLISVQRLRNLIRDEADRDLVEAVVGWLGGKRRRARLEARPTSGIDPGREPQPFFRDSTLPVDDPDPAFFAQGFLKPRSEPSGKSLAPDVLLPINLAFRLRLLLGIGARAEAVRILLTTQAPQLNVQEIAASTAYTKRNVQDAVAALRSAGTVTSTEIGNVRRFSAPTARWASFLALEEVPRHMDWPQLFAAYRKVLRFLADPANGRLSDYMLASKKRTLSDEIRPDLNFAGVSIETVDPDFTRIWAEAVGTE